ncbi:cytochrome P450 [Fennellomyces sp. T-0311]|nr:cytochrome P450 [Fennellomyces sp. T-0311]
MNDHSLIREKLYTYRYYAGFASIAFICGQLIYRYFRVPKQLRHIPAIPYWRFILSLTMKESCLSRTKRLVFPLLPKANGLYLNRMPFDWTIYVADPVLAKNVFFKPEFAEKTTFLMDAFPEDSPIFQFSGKDNVAIINGEHWKEQRKIMNPAFHRSMPVGVFGSLMPHMFQLIENSQSTGELLPTVKLTRRLTLDAIGKAAFDFDFHALKDENSVWVKTYSQVLESFMEFIPLIFPKIDYVYRSISPARNERYHSAFKLIKLLNDLADKKRAALAEKSDLDDIPQSEKDLLTLMLEAQMRGEGSWTKEELLHNMALFFLAGHDTTSNSLAFCLYLLAQHREIQTKAREEIISVLGGEPVDVFPTLDACKNFPYLDMIIKESLRLYPVGNEITPRITSKDLNLGGIVIPKGSMVNVDIQALHFNPGVWHNPEQFIPERFAENGEHSTHEGVTWAPFSGGSRQCIGINFSMMEQRVVLAMLLRKYEFQLPSDSIHKDNLIMDQAFNLAPESLKIQFTSRY